jgi:hypothetical protein
MQPPKIAPNKFIRFTLGLGILCSYAEISHVETTWLLMEGVVEKVLKTTVTDKL